MHRKSPHIKLKKIDAQKDSKSSKALRRRKNCEAAQAERQAKKELRESKAKDLKIDSYLYPIGLKLLLLGIDTLFSIKLKENHLREITPAMMARLKSRKLT